MIDLENAARAVSSAPVSFPMSGSAVNGFQVGKDIGRLSPRKLGSSCSRISGLLWSAWCVDRRW